MDKNRFDSEECLWTAAAGVTVGPVESTTEQRKTSFAVPEKEQETNQWRYQYLYIEDEDEERK